MEHEARVMRASCGRGVAGQRERRAVAGLLM